MRKYFITLIFVRTYRYLVLAFLSILVGTFVFGGIFSLSQTLSNYFISEGKILTGGDMIVSGYLPIDTSIHPFSTLRDKAYTIIEQYSLQAVFSRSDLTKNSPATIRAVDPEFPLYGTVVTDPVFSLEPGTLYAEKAFYDRLGIQKGERVKLGNTNFLAVGVIDSQPDSVALGLSFTPTVIMRKSDFLASGIDFSQSRTSYRVSLRSNQGEAMASDIDMMQKYAEEKTLRFDNALDGPNRFIRGFTSIERFVAILISISLFLVSVNIIANLTYLMVKMKKMIALLKVFGAKNSDIRVICISIFGIIGCISGALGGFFSHLVSQKLFMYLSEYFPVEIIGSNTGIIIGVGGIVGGAIMLSSAVPFLASLRDVTPRQLLSNTPNNSPIKKSKIIPYSLIPLMLSGILYMLTADIYLVSISIVILVVIFIFFMWIAHICISFLARIQSRYGYRVQASIASLRFRGVEALITISAIMTAFLGVGIITVLEKNIEVNITNTASEKAPGMYIIDIAESQIQGVTDIVGKDLNTYAIIRGRLLEVDGRDLTKSDNPGITREFNMTYRDTLITGESVIEGDWHGESQTKNTVSIDDEFASEIGGAKIGDEVEVFIQGIKLKTTISSIRKTDQSSGLPFFYLVFSPDVLEGFPVSYFGTIDVSDDIDMDALEQRLGSAYPNIIPIQTTKIRDTVITLINTLVTVAQIIGIPSIILGLILVIVMTTQSLFERRNDVLILRAFGFSKDDMLIFFTLEISTIILIAGGVSYVIAHVLAALLNVFVFDFDIFVFDRRLLAIVGISLLTSCLSAYLVARSLARTSLKKLLAEK